MTARARLLRRNETDAERKLWRSLRGGALAGLSFRRQHPVGPFVLDFYCPRFALAVELDGGQHADAATAAADRRRSAWLAARGIRVIRFWNNDVIANPAGVLETIAHAAKRAAAIVSSTPSPTLPLAGGGRGRTVGDKAGS